MLPSNAARPAPESPGNGPRKTSLLDGLDDPSIAPESLPSQARNRLRQRLVERLHRLWLAPLGHFLREVEAGANVEERLERFGRLPVEFVQALGGDRFAPSLHLSDGSCP
jgi:hypothetical protein